MTFVDGDGYEYSYTWFDDDCVHLGHFLVTGGFGEETGTDGMRETIRRFRAGGATELDVNMGGGMRAADWLTGKVARLDAVDTVTVYSVGSAEDHDNPPVHAKISLADVPDS